MTIYEQYADVQKQIEELETIQKALRSQIEKDLPEEGYKDESVTAYWTKRKSWKYSPRIDEMTASLKTAKKEEEENGTATAEETKILTIKTNNN